MIATAAHLRRSRLTEANFKRPKHNLTMGNGGSRAYDSRRHHYQAGYYGSEPDPRWSTSKRKRMGAGRHPSHRIQPVLEDEEDDYGYDYRRHPQRHQSPFPEPEYMDEYNYDSPYPDSNPPAIPFAPVASAYAQPVIPHGQRQPHIHSRSHAFPHHRHAPTPAVQMPVPQLAIPQHQHQQQPVVIPQQYAMSQTAGNVAGTNIPYPGAGAAVIPPGQTMMFPPTTAPSSAPPMQSMQPGMQMPEPNIAQSQVPMSAPSDRLAPGQYGPNDGEPPPRRSPEHRRTRSHAHHGTNYYEAPRHRHSVDSATYYQRRRQDSPLRNPLPSPPKDVFERPDLADLLDNLRLPPEETTLRRGPNEPTHALIIPPNGPARVERVMSRQGHHYPQQMHMRDRGMGEKKKSGGLFRSLSNKLKGKHRESRHIYRERDQRDDGGGIPVTELLTNQPIVITAEESFYPPPVPPMPPPSVNDMGGRQSPAVIPPPSQYAPMPSSTSPSAAGPSNNPPMRMPSPAPSQAHSQRSHRSHSSSRQQHQHQRPPPLQPLLKVDIENEFADLLHFSRHPVHYMDKVFPTAYHLYEAMKFMGGGGTHPRPDVVEMIRSSGGGQEGVNRAGEVSRDHQADVRRDWERVMVEMMENALYQKFVQNETVRHLLLATGDHALVFTDPEDGFWGDGPSGLGLNRIGQALMMIRTRLREAGYN
ncbi:hypothetical protein EIP91_008519 [Steccherinum ochraceum]|uniref:NADAR domain-containing protein n=1 Tax=Steccherinum ochraceum TaxID=92696 RepID=A0A4R0RCS4_9APHY|nr:hypothetical protein EIP91_008519 [Steccherinum ochraceum]